MSWMKRRTPAATPSPGPLQTPPPVQMYNPNQHSTQEWQQQQQPNNWYSQSTMPTVNEQSSQQNVQAYWQQQQQYPMQQQNQQQQQQYHYGNHINQSQPNNYYQQQHQIQQPQQQQTPSQQQPYEYNNMQYNYQSNNYQQQQQQPPVQPQTQQQQQPNDWNNAWGWGDEDNSNHSNVNNVQNANTVQNSFKEESWNWNVEDSLNPLKAETQNSEQDIKPDVNLQTMFPKMGERAPKPENLETPISSVPPPSALPLNRRMKAEQLTLQWSIESQVSQESSDDILQTSESDKLFSRSSTISHSPVSGHHTPQDSQIVEKSHEQYNATSTDNNCENKEIISNVKEELVDIKPPPSMLMSSISGLSNSNNTENPYKKNNPSIGHKQPHRMTPPESRGFYMPSNQSVNLETVPDNSEAPDFPISDVVQPHNLHPVSSSTSLENNEVAPLNERNQYLETGQLSDENDALPPPGLSRMVLGQFGQGDINEPPPGLSRMVLGQTETSQPTASPPVGLHRMIPGESSSPEVRFDEEEASDPELQQISRNPMQSRSATIGADTPPASSIVSREQPVVERETNLDGANIQDSTTTTDLDTLTSSVRDLTVGENTSDSRQPSDNNRRYETDSTRRHETDSDVDRPQSPRDVGRKERRHKNDDPRRDFSRDGREAPRSDRRRHRGRNYEDDTDYFSDKESNHRRAREETDSRKFSSLKRPDTRDKDRERKRRDERDRPSERRSEYNRRDREYYYNRYEDDYDDHRSSRPSSRSDSMHESFYREQRGHDRRRDRDRDRDSRRHRDPYNSYKMPGYPYDPYNPYFQQYQYYLENLRRTDPQAYAEWYRKYYQQQAAMNTTTGYVPEDKPSVHSGRSSTNDELAKERPYDYTDSSLILEDTTVSQRLTPAKFSTAHIKASVASGRLVKILPHYPMDGQSALVELDRLPDYLQADDELFELEQFPGPLVRGVTHKKTIIEYCNSKIRNRDIRKEINDPESYVLMWELLILLIRQNGMVVGADIAELLMKDRNTESLVPRPPSVASNSSGIVEASESSNAADPPGSNTSSYKEEYITSKFREYLIYGSGQQALEWAMKHSLWGHALFLASKLDKRTYAKVMTRFANGLPINDPLQTLYQLLSGHLPAAVTSVGDEKWGDWRPHLAMILSNTTQRPELDRKAITTLADTLMSRGSLYAAQFCYLMAEVGFSRYGQGGKLVLLGGDASKPFLQFAHNEAIHMTEIYEYACSLNDPAFKIPEFQAYKYLMATRLCDRGYLESALAYIEQVAVALAAIPTLVQPSLINKVCDLADRLKYYDTADYDNDADEAAISDERPDQSWLQALKNIQQQYTMGLISHESVNNLTTTTPDTTTQQQGGNFDPSPQDPWATQYIDNNQYNQQANTWSQQQHIETNDYTMPQSQQQQEIPTENYSQQYQEQQQMWNQSQQIPQQELHNQQMQDQTSQLLEQSNVQQANNDYWNNAQIEEQPRPQISMPNQSRQQRTSISEDQNYGKATLSNNNKTKEAEKKATNASSTGWFGGIWSKLALRPKNQMKLPDDKNPTIVWDQEKKRWVNLEDDNADTTTELKPPPKMNEMRPSAAGLPQPLSQQPQSLPNLNSYGMSTSQQQQQPQSLDVHPQNDGKPPLPSQNMFKMQRGRNLKKSYVDVFNPNGKPSATTTANDFQAPLMPTNNNAPMNFFVPGPVDPNAPVDFLTPMNIPHQDPNAQLHQS